LPVGNELDKIMRYEAHLSRQLYQAKHELEVPLAKASWPKSLSSVRRIRSSRRAHRATSSSDSRGGISDTASTS